MWVWRIRKAGTELIDREAARVAKVREKGVGSRNEEQVSCFIHRFAFVELEYACAVREPIVRNEQLKIFEDVKKLNNI